MLALWPMLPAWLVLYALRWQVHALAAGDDEARSLGINVTRVRLLLILAATLMTATCVSISGIVGWVGLLIPHIVRMLVGPGFPACCPCAPSSVVAICWPSITCVAPPAPRKSPWVF